MAVGEIEARAKQFRQQRAAIRSEVQKIIVGQQDMLDGVLIGVLAGGYVLLEGVPGLGKTLRVWTLAQALVLRFSRIRFTPDLMPADIAGANSVAESFAGGWQLVFQHRRVFANVILAVEINGATPKTQSALLAAMQERPATAGREMRRLEELFFVLATQNPIEQEGACPPTGAQADRFLFKLLAGAPSLLELGAIVDRTAGAEMDAVLDGLAMLAMQALGREAPLAAHVKEYALTRMLTTHRDSGIVPDPVRRFVRCGASPRGVQALVFAAKIWALLSGRYNVSCDDIRQGAAPAPRYRIILNFEGEAGGVRTDALATAILTAAAPAVDPPC